MIKGILWLLINYTYVEGKPGEIVIRSGFPEKIEKIVKLYEDKAEILKDIYWTISNICG